MYFLKISLKLALGHLLKKKVSRVFAVFSVSILLLMVGALVVLHQNLSATFEEISSFSSLTVFLRSEAKETDVEQMKKNVVKIPGVLHADLVSKEEFIKKFAKVFPSLREPLAEADLELVPSYLKVRVKSESLAAASELIRKMPSVEEVETNKERLMGALLALSQFKNIVVFMMLGLMMALSTLIFNHFKSSTELALQMKKALGSMGAKKIFIFLPFAIEGAVEGLSAGVLAGLGFLVGGQIFQAKLFEVWKSLGYSVSEIQNTSMLLTISLLLVLSGVVLGMSGSLWAILRVRKNH